MATEGFAHGEGLAPEANLAVGGCFSCGHSAAVFNRWQIRWEFGVAGRVTTSRWSHIQMLMRPDAVVTGPPFAHLLVGFAVVGKLLVADQLIAQRSVKPLIFALPLWVVRAG